MHVAVLGAGYAGVSLVQQLESSLPDETELTLVDERDIHLVQHLLHRLIRKPHLEERITIPIDDLLTRAQFRQARVTGVDPDAGRVELSDGELSYDVGAVCLGAQTAFYGLPGVTEHATPLKRVEHARQIRTGFEAVQTEGGRAVVCGAGLSGIQVAGELAELAREAETNPSVVLLEQKSDIAPSFPAQFQDAVREELLDRGVEIRTDTSVSGADEAALELGADRLAYDQLIWTGGLTGQDALGDRPQVRATLRYGDRTFAVGDAARVIDADGNQTPATAQTAVRQASVAATNIERLSRHQEKSEGFEPQLKRYRYRPLGWLVSVGDGSVAQVGPSVVRGRAAEALKTTVGAGYLTSVGAVRDAAQYVRGEFSGSD
ncbi:NAD(P)/FAD-dependent oxidoreductase [Halovenus marina]|uniref:NAD(P)/FAD-dependent oxidoreductase n=1 Tax=Halovenus marina TaxID=3396621 RepID=UPI003F57F9BA